MCAAHQDAVDAGVVGQLFDNGLHICFHHIFWELVECGMNPNLHTSGP